MIPQLLHPKGETPQRGNELHAWGSRSMEKTLLILHSIDKKVLRKCVVFVMQHMSHYFEVPIQSKDHTLSFLQLCSVRKSVRAFGRHLIYFPTSVSSALQCAGIPGCCMIGSVLQINVSNKRQAYAPYKMKKSSVYALKIGEKEYVPDPTLKTMAVSTA